MLKTWSSFIRGALAGILFWAGIIGLGGLFARFPAFVPQHVVENVRLIAAVNTTVGFGVACLIYGFEVRSRRA